MTAFLLRSVVGAAMDAETLLPVFCLLTAAEIAFPIGAKQRDSRLKALVFWSLTLPVAGACGATFALIPASLHVRPLFALTGWQSTGPFWRTTQIAAMLVVSIIAEDFFFYWMHRAQHRFFWRFHRVHHSITNLTAVSSYTHISEELFRAVFITAPMWLFVTVPAPVAALLAALVALQGFYVHTAARIHLGRFRAIIADNRFHRVHHSLDPAHHDKNFAAFTPIWDIVFGTAYWPRADEWPDTGLDELAEPETVAEWIASPLNSSRQ